MAATGESISAGVIDRFFTESYFPRAAPLVSFGNLLNDVFFKPGDDNRDYPIHGPNVIRFTRALFGTDFNASGLINDQSLLDEAQDAYMRRYAQIMDALGVGHVKSNGRVRYDTTERGKVRDVLLVAALYHDVGKTIRRENHPQIGANLLRSYSEDEQKRLVDALQFPSEASENPGKYNRFSLIGSIVQHHDKFGVVSTGEGALPLFSDILYFTSNETTLAGVAKNITSVMLMNLADIAAVNTASQQAKARSLDLAVRITGLRASPSMPAVEEPGTLKELLALASEPSSCLGLSPNKINRVLEDWSTLLEAINHPSVQGNRVQLKMRLIEIERNPARTIQRVQRLLQETSETSKVPELFDYVSQTSVESVLVSTLGAHQFQTFCERLATVVKFDYGLKFFKTVLCACVRKRLTRAGTSQNQAELRAAIASHPSFERLEPEERAAFARLDHDQRVKTATSVTILFVKVLESLISRYSGVLEATSNPRRFGFQMRDLTKDDKVRSTIMSLLCIEEEKDAIALTWIADEVTIWSMD
jgi:hypothetical protein